jgi:methionine synthase I (cobalamin-dependent)/5,10-methylenetetrahydrofolate reductase
MAARGKKKLKPKISIEEEKPVQQEPGAGGRSFVFDGAFGTYYYKKNSAAQSCEAANIDDREAVYKIHKEYIDAGVDAIKTNTFGANSRNFPDDTMRKTIIRNGFELAMTAVKDTTVLVFADIGCFSVRNASENAPGPASDVEILQEEEYRSIAEQFVSLGATHFLFETFAEYEPVLPAIRWIRSRLPGAFIILSFAVSQDGYTRKGLYYKSLLEHAFQNPDIDVCGLNCICGPSHIAKLLQNLDIKGKPLCAMPNSGYPSTIGGRTVFQDNAGYFAGKLGDLHLSGIGYLGGCCGTTPEHMRQAVTLLQKPLTGPGKERPAGIPLDRTREYSPHKVNLFRDKLISGQPVIAVELDPPMDTDVTFLLAAAKKAKISGADIITLADSPLARTRADSILLAAKVKRETGIDVLPHLSCRDRNPIGLKASLLGAAIEDINNILIVTGDPITQTDRGETKGVFSYNSFQLIAFVKSLNDEVLAPAPVHIAAALNVNAASFDIELRRAQNKIDKGAELFLTQPLYSEESIRNAIEAKKVLSARILFGIMPVASYKNAMFLQNEVSGIHIPQDFIEKLEGRTQREVEEISLRFCMDIVARTRDAADGFYLMTPICKIDLVCELIRRIHLKQYQNGSSQ